MTAAQPELTARARAIATGLIRTGRAIGGRIVALDGFMRLDCRGGGFYWVSADGLKLLRGDALWGADELQPKFADAMERAGAAARA